MSARVLRFSDYAARPAQYCLLLSELPGHGLQTLGVLLLDTASDTLHIRLRRDWSFVGEDEDAEVLSELSDDLQSLAREVGGGGTP